MSSQPDARSDARSEIRFEVRPFGDGLDAARELMPYVYGVQLADRVADRWAGLVLDYYRYGDLRRYLLGRPDSGDWKDGRIALLVCSCGELGCDSITARVAAEADWVVWSEFTRPPSQRHVDHLGPFVFERAQYDEAISQLIHRIGDVAG